MIAPVLSVYPFDTLSAAENSIIDRCTRVVETLGFCSVGDCGGARYIRASYSDICHLSPLLYFRSQDRYSPSEAIDEVDGGYWVLHEGRPNPFMAGAKGDGVTDDLAAINAVAAYMRWKGGGEFDLLPSGGAYVHSDTIVLGDGVAMVGSATSTFPGTSEGQGAWTRYGSWLKPTHAINPGVRLYGHGSSIRGINFWHDQPKPHGGVYVPNNYGYAIEVASVYSTIEDIIIANATYGIILNYTTTSGGGTGVSLRNILASCIKICLNTTCVNDTIHIENFHARPIWETEHLQTVYFQNTTAWDCGYTDNCIVNGFEAVFLNMGMYFRNQICLDNTHSMYNAQLSGVQLSLCKQAMKVENAGAVVTGQITDLVIQQGNMFGLIWPDECMTLNSDFVDLQIGSLRVNEAGGSVLTLGHGIGGKMQIANLDVLGYSSAEPGRPAFCMSLGSRVRFGSYRITKSSRSGSRFAGAGMDAGLQSPVYGIVAAPFGEFLDSDVTASTSAWRDLSTDFHYRPALSGAHQVRLVAEIYVASPQPSTSLQLRFSGMPETETAAQGSSSPGWKTFDTGWVDIGESTIFGMSSAGRLQANIAASVRIQSGTVNLLVR